jgi:hypothetical protein
MPSLSISSAGHSSIGRKTKDSAVVNSSDAGLKRVT